MTIFNIEDAKTDLENIAAMPKFDFSFKFFGLCVWEKSSLDEPVELSILEVAPYGTNGDVPMVFLCVYNFQFWIMNKFLYKKTYERKHGVAL